MLINKKIKQILSSPFIRNASWLGGAELVNRIFRLGTTVTLARTFSPQDYGLVAVVYTTFEFATVFTLRSGIGAKIIQADEHDVKTICDTSYWLNWILCGSIFTFQCIAAFLIAQFYGNKQLILPICTIALIYLILPLFMVQSAMIERENRLEIRALCNVTQSLFSNIITVILALLGMGVWAIVWAMVISTPVWLVISWMNHPWRPSAPFNLERWQEITSFGANLLGAELLGKIRGNLDYLIIGKFMGLEVLGLYYFAFNAGLGISLSVLSTFTSALFPYLCEVRGNVKQLKARFFRSLKKTSLIIGAVILAQASLVPFYIPILFGQKWTTVVPIVVLFCLSALPFPLGCATDMLLNTVDKTHISLGLNFIYTTIFAISLLVAVAVKGGILGVAISVIIGESLTTLIGSIWTIKYVFRKIII